MKEVNKNVLLLMIFLTGVILLSGIVTANDSLDNQKLDESSYSMTPDVASLADDNRLGSVEVSDDNIQDDSQNDLKSKSIKNDTKLETIYVNSQASQSNSGADRENPTTLNNAITNIADGGTIYLVTDSLTDTYNLTSAISLSRYSNNINSLKIVGEENKNITLSGNDKSQVLNLYSVTLNVSNVNFKDTRLDSSSMIYASSSTISFDNCSFTNNYRKDYGSSIYASYSTVILKDCLFKNNSADYGGAVYLTRSNMTVDSSYFDDNTAFSGSAIYALNSNLYINSSRYNGNNASFGASIYNLKSNITCSNTTFSNNTALYYGGAIIHLSEGNTVINNSNFTSNKAGYGGAVYVMQSDLNVTFSVFENNIAETASAIFAYNNSIVIKNNCLVDDELNASVVSIMHPKAYILDENWWGVNNPDFYRLTGGYIPDTWVLMNFRNYTSDTVGKINLNVSLNQLSAQAVVQNPLPARTVIFSSDDGEGVFEYNNMNITNSVSNEYSGDLPVYARIDNQSMQLNAKIIPTLLVGNYTTNESNINLTITANKDITGNFNLTINNYTTTLTAKQKTRLYYPISDLTPGEYTINLTYGGNSKYDRASIISYLVVQSKEYSQNETIVATLTKEDVNNTALPTKYNLLDLDLVTPVKSQGSAGSCVSFATIGVLESALKKLSNVTYDLSENNLKNMFKKYSIYGLSSLEPNDGGYDMEPVGYLASGLGPVLEAIDEYNTQSHISNVFDPLFQAQNIYFIPARKNFTDNNLIKQAIMKYGAMYTGVKLSSSLNQYNIGVNQSTHAVCIVGWDDTYSRTNFSPNAPGDGAFIIKNSWGENTGNNGYQYVSYYDSVIGNIPYVDDYNSLNFVVDFNNPYNYSNIYQYDSVCYVYTLGDTDGQYWINNSYTMEKDEVISAVGTYFVDDSEYEIKVYVNTNLVATKEGKLTQAGYQTIALDNLYRVKKNDEVMVVIRIKQNINSNYVYVPLQDGEYPIMSDNPKSFISYTGLQFENLKSQDSVAPIKLYTMNVAGFDTIIDVESRTINVKTNISNLDADAKLYYRINDEFIRDSNGDIIYSDLNADDDFVELFYDTSSITQNNATLETILSYKGLNITKSLQFNPVSEIRLEADNITAYISTDFEVMVNVTNQDNEKLSQGYIEFKDSNDTLIASSNVLDGQASVTLRFNNAYDDVLTLSYFDDNGELLAENTINLLVKKHGVNIQVENVTANADEKINLTAHLTDENGININSGKLTFKINGKTIKDTNGKVIYLKVIDGTASVEYILSSSLAGTTLNLEAVYSGSKQYDSVTNESTITVTASTPTFACEDITANRSSQITLKAAITDGNSIVNKGKVVFKINGKTVKDANGKVIYAKIVDGIASVNYTLPDSMKTGSYNITAVLISSDYPRFEDTKPLTVI